ncbi:M14 family zinc carboxypeptidase [Novipirellula artificiosorum]|uniref:Zinc carboxypeptidase n=1 Tax=Novipirellula artificiosorum TaxID=2528016 RepID=A0A5C6D336_9BACT|nr:M14 family zinc carboxypeptidase [Novipirellula artificiosorum]TWU31158.1 Zinc carboxypeptidase [Novipirellula artificiosorum]
MKCTTRTLYSGTDEKPVMQWVAALLPSVLFLLSSTVSAQTLTYEEAKAKIPNQNLPDFWISTVDDLADRWQRLQHGTATTIATSPGGHPLHLIAFGEREDLPHQANFNSAIGGKEPAAYMDKDAREKPVVYFVGPVHGHEVEGLTGLVNLIQVMETGRDLRGKDQTSLQQLGQRCRVLIVPAGNPDGIARFEPRSCRGMTLDEFQFWGQGTSSDDTIAIWPVSKRRHPRVGPEIGWLGCYFNNDGINPMHDEFFAPMGPEAPAILKVAMKEGPDVAVSLHSHGAAPTVLRPAYVPMEVQERVRSLAQRHNALLSLRDLPHGGVFEPESESGKVPPPFNLTSALYHISGAMAFTHECPHGIVGEKMCDVTFDQILDIQLTLYEVMFQQALDGR